MIVDERSALDKVDCGSVVDRIAKDEEGVMAAFLN